MKLQSRLNERYSSLTQHLASREAEKIHRTLDLEVVREICDRLSLDAAISGEALSINGLLHRWRKVASIASTALIIGGFGSLLLSANTKDIWQKFCLSHAAIGCWYLAKNQRKITEQSTPVIQLLSYLQIARSTQELSQLWEGGANQQVGAIAPQTAILDQPVLPASLAVFNWSELETHPDKFPHIMLLGKTGSGKSVLAEWLLRRLGGKLTVITPHSTPKDWQGIEVVGGGRNFAAISLIFNLLVEEMDRRYEQYSQGFTDFEFWNVAIDELPAIVATCENVPDQLKVLIREARKVRIRLLLLTQGAEVKALKVEGEGSIRDSLTFIRLGNFATDYARKLKDENLQAWLQQQQRPCLIDEMPAVVPNLG